MWVPENRLANLQEINTLLLGMALSLAVFGLRNRWPKLGTCIYVVSSLPLYVLIYQVYGREVTLALYAMTTLIAALLLGFWPGVGTGLASMGFMLLLPLPAGSSTRYFWFLLVALAGGIGLVTEHVLHLLEFWERETTANQRQMIGELRLRQGELNRTLKALDEAYASLKRSNEELAALREVAEEARVLKEQFVANVSHELRTPLNLIVGFAEMMYLAPESYEGVVWTPDLESDIGHMHRASKHLQSLIDDILDLSRIDATRLPMFRELADVRTIISDTLETAAPLLEQHHLSYALEAPNELPQLFVDRTRIRQTILNLLNNAVRFTDSGGITIRVEQVEQAVLISIQDTGIGIPEDQLEHIFEEFRQASSGRRSRGGAGLGLAISRKFVEMHGGRMWVESTVGEGSIFYLTLPLPGASPQAQALYRTPGRRKTDPHSTPILLVEPDATIANMLGRYLGDRPVLTASNAQEAEQIVQQQHPQAVIVNQPPDVPLEEWFGPLGPWSRIYGVPVLRCSIPSPSWLRRSADVLDCLTKPISRQTLRDALANISPRPRRILVVDDDPGFLSLVRRMFSTIASDIEVSTASTGAYALRLMRQAQPDLLLLDLLMPEIDGAQVLEVIRNDERLRSTRVVIVTGTSYAQAPLHQLGSYFTITQTSGLRAGTLADLLNAVLELVQPRYEPLPEAAVTT